MIPTDFVPAILLIACAAASLGFVLWRGRRTPPDAGGDAAHTGGPWGTPMPPADIAEKQAPDTSPDKQESAAADRPPQAPDAAAGAANRQNPAGRWGSPAEDRSPRAQTPDAAAGASNRENPAGRQESPSADWPPRTQAPDAAAGASNRENPAGRQESPTAERPQPPQKPAAPAGPPMPARFTRAAASWRGFAGALAGAVLYGLIRGLARNGFRPPEDMSSAVPMLGFMGLCLAAIVYGFGVWRPRHMARRAEQEAAADPLDFAVQPSLLPLGLIALVGGLGAAGVCAAAWWRYPEQLAPLAAGTGGLWALLCLVFGVLGCLPALRVQGNTCTLRSWDLRRRRFALTDIARCQLSCFSWKSCPHRGKHAAALAALPPGQRPLCLRGNIRLTFYAADGRRLCRFYGDARNLSVLLGRLRGRCRFETKPCIPIRPDGPADAAAEN